MRSIATILAAGLLALAPAAANADFGISSFSASSSSGQAGAHADVTTSFTLNTDDLGNPVDQLKDVQLDLPPGVIGNPQAAPMCSHKDFQNFNCPADAQIGILNASFVTGPGVTTTLTALPTSTTLTDPVDPCQFCQSQTLNVGDTTGMTSGDYVQIGDGGSAESVPVANVLGPTSLQISGAVANSHAAGETVADETITVDSTTGFNGTAEGGNNVITIGSGPSAEQAQIAFFPSDATHLILSAPLTGTHSVGDSVTHIATTAAAPIPLFNLQPLPGHVASFGASLLFVALTVNADVRNDGSYGLTASLSDVSTLLSLSATDITLWGVPADSSHDGQRCGQLAQNCVPAGVPAKPFMTNPTDCGGGPLTTTIHVDSWQDAGNFITEHANQPAPTGCDKLAMNPSIKVTPDTTRVDTPAGYDVDLRVPQNDDPYGLATPDLKDVSVTLPPGTSLSPPVANGLGGCSDAQFGAGSCPDASKIGTVSITSPLLPDHLTGAIYLAAPTPTATYRTFLIASADNVTIKLTGGVHPDPGTGQLTATFTDNPQQPFSELRLRFFGGPLAPLANPATCGTATTTSSITAYGTSANPALTASPSSSFTVDADGAGGTCPAAPPFAPGFSAGSEQPLAGAFTPFSVTVTRNDGEQNLGSLTADAPPGLLGMLSAIPLCPEPQASQGTCGPESRIGSTTVSAGAGSRPLSLDGTVYLAGPYKGSPFSLSIAVPATHVGPFDFGVVVVRAKADVDPVDAHLTISSDALPQMLQGIPLRLRAVHVSIDQPGFTFNPTSCAPAQVGGTVGSAQGASVSVSSPFSIGGCAGLSFNPKLSATTAGKTSKANGASLNVHVPGPGQANLQSVAVTLPKKLAPRGDTLGLACARPVFAADPSSCPAGSNVGSVTARSPVIPVPLTGPVYLVAGGSGGFPDLNAVISGAGVTIKLVGSIVIKGTRTTSTFGGIPDVPITAFDLTFPQGPHSALQGSGLCTGNILMPTTFIAHDGAQVKRVIHVKATGCPAKKKKAAKKTKAKKRKARAAGTVKGSAIIART